ncbi:sce7726 family protein [Paenibacillus sp. PsM32]|uniref:sce7726 family protein n=1 Tax=Paenibacillus sp. PsM32 TaxID=3030536 RepID=UPI00263A8EA0|nr:sce7726 family protein [Paenibacillus sp. PsM32]MDN4617685.1 sce7726 family protein [Paenibacillus sp. PsM32]
MNIHSDLKQRTTAEELTRIVKTLHDHYHPFLLDNQVWDLLKRTLPEMIYEDVISPYQEHIVGHKLVNNIVMNLYFGEKKVKYHLSQKYLHRKGEVSMFELNLGSSRLDYARINGHSYAYEIKTELDSLDKLEKQISDYSKAFEYVQVVCHPYHYKKVKENVPSFCGIVTYNDCKTDLPFSFKQKRLRNPNIDASFQLSTLTAKELDKILKEENLNIDSLDRQSKQELISLSLSSAKINHHFKEKIKARFQKRWDFVCSHIDSIEPIDIQSFFKSNADPYWVYYKNSSIVCR